MKKAERKLKKLAGPTGWKVLWNDGWFWRAAGMQHRDDYASVVLESPDGKTWVNVGTTAPARLDSYGRDFVFACALADIGGKRRPKIPEFGGWIQPCVVPAASRSRVARVPDWLVSKTTGECLVKSAEEFMFKLSMFGC